MFTTMELCMSVTDSHLASILFYTNIYVSRLISYFTLHSPNYINAICKHLKNAIVSIIILPVLNEKVILFIFRNEVKSCSCL